jgi:hypothetical protein
MQTLEVSTSKVADASSCGLDLFNKALILISPAVWRASMHDALELLVIRLVDVTAA